MGRKKRQEQDPLEVMIMFEPSRLAADHLAEAYRQVVPPQGSRRNSDRPLSADDVLVEIRASARHRRSPS
jgi:hypothetical protein